MSEGIMYIPRPADAPEPSPISAARAMEWFLFANLLFIPRLFLVGLWIFSDLLGDAFSSWVIPAVGFLLLPGTTLAYAFMWGNGSDKVYGWEWIVVAIGFGLDAFTWFVASRLARR